jgi:hypothetical protein
VDWAAHITRVAPPLEGRRPRWPIILWENGPFTPQPQATYEALLARGVTQHVTLDPAHLPVARAVAAAGSPVVMMEGMGGTWPAELGGAREVWQHRLDPGYVPRAVVKPCPMWLDGWAAAGRRVRDTLTRYKASGVPVDAVWMDWEGDPMPTFDAYEQARHCSRCRGTIPPAALVDAASFRTWRGRLWFDLLGAYLAAPVAEIFPAASITNWMATISTPERPLPFWEGTLQTPALPSMVSATNPVAYGIDEAFETGWSASWPVDRLHVDRFFTNVLLRMVSVDTANRAAWAPHLKSIPWVARWCHGAGGPDPRVPIMSRERYREVLRHLWLRGVDGMQVFNPVVPRYEHLAEAEVEDALAVQAEMLAEGDVLGGAVLALAVPEPQSEGVVWSGRVLGDRAVVRAFSQNGREQEFVAEVFPGQAVRLTAGPQGRTFRLRLRPAKVELLP